MWLVRPNRFSDFMSAGIRSMRCSPRTNSWRKRGGNSSKFPGLKHMLLRRALRAQQESSDGEGCERLAVTYILTIKYRRGFHETYSASRSAGGHIRISAGPTEC